MPRASGRQSQLSLDLPEVERVRRRRRRRPRPVAPADPQERALLPAPSTLTCGRCGRLVTLFGQAGTCPQCGATVIT